MAILRQIKTRGEALRGVKTLGIISGRVENVGGVAESQNYPQSICADTLRL
jgi:hypothetical protein